VFGVTPCTLIASRVFTTNPPVRALAVTLTMPSPLPAKAVSRSPWRDLGRGAAVGAASEWTPGSPEHAAAKASEREDAQNGSTDGSESHDCLQKGRWTVSLSTGGFRL
jgi:hypothetical protein